MRRSKETWKEQERQGKEQEREQEQKGSHSLPTWATLCQCEELHFQARLTRQERLQTNVSLPARGKKRERKFQVSTFLPYRPAPCTYQIYNQASRSSVFREAEERLDAVPCCLRIRIVIEYSLDVVIYLPDFVALSPEPETTGGPSLFPYSSLGPRLPNLCQAW